MTAIDPSTLTGKQLWLNQTGLPGAVSTRGLWTDATGAACSLQMGTNPVVDVGPDATRRSIRFDTGSYAYARDMTGFANQEIWLLLKGASGVVAPFDLGKDTSLGSHYPWSDSNFYDDAYSTSRTSFAWSNSLAEMASWGVLRFKLTGAALEYWVNNTLRLTRGSGMAAANIWNTLRLGGNGTTASTGWIAEALVFDHNLTTLEAQGVYEYLSAPLNPFTDSLAGSSSLGFVLDRPLSFITDLSVNGANESGEPGSLTKTGWLRVTAQRSSMYRFDLSPVAGVAGLNVYTGPAPASQSAVTPGTAIVAVNSPSSTETIVPGSDLSVSASGVSAVQIDLNYRFSMNHPGVNKAVTLRVRRNSEAGAVLYTQVMTDPGVGDNSLGYGWNTGWQTFVDTSPGTGHYVVTVQATSTSTNPIFSDTRVFQASPVPTASSSLALAATGTSAAPLKALLAAGVYFLQLGQVSGTVGSVSVGMRNGLDYTDEVLADAPILFWPMDDLMGSQALLDWSGFGRHAAVQPAGPTSDWWFSQASRLPGSVAGSAPASLNNTVYWLSPSYTWPTSGFITLEWWEVFSGAQYMVLDFNDANFLDVIHNNPAGTWGLNNGAVDRHGCSVLPADGRAHHCAVVVPMQASTTGMKLYLDGVAQTLTGTAFTTVALGTSRLRVNSWQGSGWWIPAGQYIDNIAVYTGELSAARVAAHYRAGASPFANAFELAQTMGVPTVLTGLDSTGWTTQASEPLTLPKDKTGWAYFIPLASGVYQLDSIGSGYDTGIALYTGTAIGALTLVASDDDSGGSGTSKIVTHLTAGVRYYIQVGAGAAAVTLSGTLNFALRLTVYDGAAVPSPTYLTMAEAAKTGWLLKGRVTKAFDTLPGG